MDLLPDRAVCVVVDDGELLVVQRHRDGRDYCVLPGGGIESGEDPPGAALRELSEETGLTGRVVRPLWRLRHPDRTAHYLLVAVERAPLRLGGPEAAVQSPVERHVPSWVALTELDEVGLEPAELRPLVRGLGRS